MLDAADGFRSGQLTPAVAVFRNPSGLGAQGRATIAAKRAALDQATIEGATDV